MFKKFLLVFLSSVMLFNLFQPCTIFANSKDSGIHASKEEIEEKYQEAIENENLTITRDGPESMIIVNDMQSDIAISDKTGFEKNNLSYRAAAIITVWSVQWFDEYARVTIMAYGTNGLKIEKASGNLEIWSVNNSYLSGTYFEIYGGWSGDNHETYDVWVGNNDKVNMKLTNLKAQTRRHGFLNISSASKIVSRR